MAKEEQKRVSSSMPMLIALAFITGGVVLTRLPLESVRPQPPEGLELAKTDQHLVEARLWQDPFKVAQDHAKMERQQADGTKRSHPTAHAPDQISRLLAEWQRENELKGDPPPAVHILTIMVQDGDTAEDYELRLRNRYAALTALNAAGMEPDETRHIRYFTLSKIDKRYFAPDPLIVPFEIFNPEKLYPEPNEPADGQRPDHLILVWLPESALEKKPMHALKWLLREYIGLKDGESCYEQLGGTRPPVKLDVIGPTSSTTLQVMLEDLTTLPKPTIDPNYPLAKDPNSPLSYVTLFSPWSTASPVLLTSGLSEGGGDGRATSGAAQSADSLLDMFDLVTSRFADAGVTFVRMIGTDDLLALHLIEELQRRQIDVVGKGWGEGGAEVALISEWDTFYGKAFPLTFAAMVRCFDPNGGDVDWDKYARHLGGVGSGDPYLPLPNIHAYSYIGGIDGRLPASDAQSKQSELQKTTDGESTWTYRKSLELPIGRGQLDYARRLAAKLHEYYAQRGHRQLQAIGVVGSDVYDKMTLLHALREEFGDITLFTTDLDARLLQHKQLTWTQNVIVASNYGLELNREYQCRIRDSAVARGPSPFAPFRGNYQTALFLACRSALGLKAKIAEYYRPFRDLPGAHLVDALAHPRLFEIGRGQAIDLSVTDKVPQIALHPERPENPGLLSLFRRYIWPVLSAIAAVMLLWPVVRGMRPLVSHLACREHEEVTTFRATFRAAFTAAFWKRHYLILGAIALIALVLYIIFKDHYDPAGEPFSLTAGTSAWPGILIYLLIMVLSISFVRTSLEILSANEEAIANEFGLAGRRALSKRVRAYVRIAVMRARASLQAWLHNKRAKPPTKEKVKEKEKEKVYAWKIWKNNVVRWFFSDRVFWPCVWFVAFWLFPILLVLALGEPHAPCRGSICYVAYELSASLAYSALLVLLILIAGETHRRLRIINPIIDRETVWPAKLFDSNTQPDIVDWLDVRFVARVTEGAGKLVYFPALILLLCIAARLPYFDNWGYPLLFYIVFAIPIAYIVSLLAKLQLAGRRARATALYHLQRKLEKIDLGAVSDSERRHRIERMITEIEGCREGAFRPFSENPVVHALLIPSGGAGLLALLTYLLPG